MAYAFRSSRHSSLRAETIGSVQDAPLVHEYDHRAVTLTLATDSDSTSLSSWAGLALKIATSLESLCSCSYVFVWAAYCILMFYLGIEGRSTETYASHPFHP